MAPWTKKGDETCSGLAYAVVLEGTVTQMQPLAKHCDERGEDLQIQTTEELKVTRFAHSKSGANLTQACRATSVLRRASGTSGYSAGCVTDCNKNRYVAEQAQEDDLRPRESETLCHRKLQQEAWSRVFDSSGTE